MALGIGDIPNLTAQLASKAASSHGFNSGSGMIRFSSSLPPRSGAREAASAEQVLTQDDFQWA